MIYSIQLKNDDNEAHYADIWLKFNGSDYPDSSTRFHIPARKNASEFGYTVATVNFVGTSINPNDYVELWWSSDSTSVSLEHIPAGSDPVSPATPSVIATFTQVMYLQSGSTGATGNIGATGSQGNIGSTGSVGNAGSTGATGSQGNVGATGASFSSPYTGNIQINGQSWVTADVNGNTAASTTVNWNDSNIQTFTLNTATTTFTFSNPNAGATYILVIRQNAAGSQTIVWPGTVAWAGGITPIMTPTANRYDVFTFIYDGSKYFGSYVQNFT